MRLRTSIIVVLLFFLVGACNHSTIVERPVPRFEKAANGEAFPVEVPGSYESTRGWLVVAEDRSDPLSPEIRLPVAIVRSRNQTSESPVLYLSGGPGTSAMSAAAYPGAYPWLAERDFVVLAQRGTQTAQPALMCPEYRAAVAAETQLQAAITECRNRLTKAGVGIQHYNSTTSAADIEDLRNVLGIDQWNLYGVSYGTRLALTYARVYAGRTRTMLLDSPLPPNAIYDDESAINFEAALRAVAADCANQAPCDSAFPELEQRFFKTLAKAADTRIVDQNTDRPVTGAQLASLISLGSSDAIRQAPLRMDAVARLDPIVLTDLARTRRAGDFAWGMRLSVWCSEAWPFSKRSLADGPDDVLGGFESAAIRPGLCDAWNVPALDSSVIEPVVSDIPTLIVAGQFDPLTPPSWGSRAADTLENSLLVSVRGESHLPTQQWGGDGCAMELVAAFIRMPERLLAGQTDDFCVFSRAAPSYATSSQQ